MKLIIDIPYEAYYTFKCDLGKGNLNALAEIVANGTPYEERPQVKCEKCDYRKFTETFVDGVVDVMNKNGITSVEQLQEILKGGAE